MYNICYTAPQISQVQTQSMAIYQSMLYCVVGDEQGAVMQADSRPGRFVISDLPVVMILVGSKRIDGMECLLDEVKIIKYSIKLCVCIVYTI